MPILGFARTHDLVVQKSSLDDDLKTLASRVDALDARTTALQKCTPLIRGVHLCREPMYDKVAGIFDLTPKSLMHLPEDVCIRVETLNDFIPADQMRHTRKHLGTLDLPDNYLCLSKAAVEQYVDAFVPDTVQKYIDERGNKSWDDAPPPPRCAAQCSAFTCDQIREGAHMQPSPDGRQRAWSRHDKDPYVSCGFCTTGKCAPYA